MNDLMVGRWEWMEGLIFGVRSMPMHHMVCLYLF